MSEQKKVKKLIESARIGMFTTQKKGALYSRPIAISQVDDENNIWFFTDIGSEKIDEIMANQQINFSFSNESSNEYVSISGEAYPVKDQEKIDSLWNAMIKVWFPNGKESNNLTLVKVIPETAQYWDGTSSRIIQLYKMAKAIATGKGYEKLADAENKVVIF